MLDIKFIRENPKLVAEKSKQKNVEIDIKRLLDVDSQLQKVRLEVQGLREERNNVAKSKDITKGKQVKEALEKKEEKLPELEKEFKNLMINIPNPVLDGVPIGGEENNEVIKTVGKPTKFNFDPKDHVSLAVDLDLIDIERAAKVSGSRFAYLKNQLVFLELALIQFALENLSKEGFIPVFPPVLIKHEITEGLGYWNTGNNNNYYFVSDYEELEGDKEKENPLYLIGTGEHAVVPIHKDEVLEEKELPKKYVVFSSCFRREAGSYGKDTQGILRVHQFDKVEMVEFIKPEDDEKERRNILSLSEKFMQDLGLPYQLVKLASGDLGFPSAETIDIETWLPGQNKYRETHSISTTTDFQARRLNIKYKSGNENKFVNILNGTAFAIGRTLIAIMENYQQKDGSIDIPKVLQKYTNFDKIPTKS